MVKARLLFLISALFLLWGCPAGPPTGPDTNISRKLMTNCLISPYEDTLKVFVSKWSEISEYENDDASYLTFYDYWSVSGAKVKIAVDGNTLPVEEDTLKEYDEFYQIYHYYYYRFPNVVVRPGQRWELSVSHPDFDSISAEAIVPDSVEFIEIPDTIKTTSDNLYFSWARANGAEGYLTLLKFTAVKDNGDYWSRQIHLDFKDEGDGVASYLAGNPQQSRSIEYVLKTMLEEIKYFYSRDKDEIGNLSEFNSYYLRLYVYSMNEALYNIQCLEIKPDELSGFNVPINAYSNVENGSGILGAFWRTASEKIIIDKEFFISQCQ